MRPLEALELAAEAVLESPSLSSSMSSSTLLPSAQWHLSLSRTLYLKEFQVAPLVQRLRQSVRAWAAARPPTRPARLELWTTGCRAFCNEDRSCAFLALQFGSAQNELQDLLGHVDTALVAQGYPAYYDDPDFHISLAWSLNPDAWPRAQTDAAAATLRASGAGQATLFADEVIVRAAGKLYPIPLAADGPGSGRR